MQNPIGAFFFIILLLCILIAESGAENTSDNVTNAEWYTLNDTVGGFSIEYPAGTEVWQADQKEVYRDLMITSPANITMLKLTFLPGNKTLNRLEEIQETSLTNLSNFTLIKKSDTQLANLEAVRYDYSWSSKTGELSRSFIILAPGKLGTYIIRHDNSEANYVSDIPIIEKIVNSFTQIPVIIDTSQSKAYGNDIPVSDWGYPSQISNMWNQPVTGYGQGNNGYSNLQYTQDPQTGYIYIGDPASGKYVVYDPLSSLIYEPTTGSYYNYNSGTGQIIPYSGPNVQGQYNYPVDIGKQANIYQTPPIPDSGYTDTPEDTSTITPSPSYPVCTQTETPDEYESNSTPDYSSSANLHNSGNSDINSPSSTIRGLLIIPQKDYQEDELSGVQYELDLLGIGYDIVSPQVGLATGMSGGKVQIDKSIDQISDSDVKSYSGLIIIGGEGSTEYLWNNIDLQKLIQTFDQENKLISAICLSPAVLGKAGIVNGKKNSVSGSPDAEEILKAAGAVIVNDAVVTDGRIITANGPSAADEFGTRVANYLMNQ